MRVSRKKLAHILFFSLIHIILIGASFYFLYTSPSVGIMTAWDKTLKHWKVESAEPWSVLREGDLIKSIGGVDIGYPHLQNAIFKFGTRKEVLAWFEARKDLYKRLRKEESNFGVIRDTKERTINIRLGKAGYSFLSSTHVFYLVHALSLLIVGFAVICKKGEDTERFLLFSICSCFFGGLITFIALISPKLSMEPHFEFLISVLSTAFCIPFAYTQMLHFTLLVPKKSVILDRVPRLPLVEYAAGLLVLSSLHPNLLFLASCVMLTLVLAATVHAFFSCSDSVEKSQVKWLGAGYLGWLPAIVFVFIPKLVTGEEFVRPEFATITLVLMPLCMAFAIHRYRLCQESR